MLILCIGPDTFRAQAHAKKLEDAFREKYDAVGTSIEHISFGKVAIKELGSKAQTMSLFEPKRFFRTRNLLKECTKKELPSLARVLSKNTDDVIVVSIEEAEPKKEYLSDLEKEVKIIKYSYPLVQGFGFLKWLQEEAKHFSISDEASIKKIATRFDGDSWRAWNELMKLAAGGDISATEQGEQNTFQLIDEILKNKINKYSFLTDEGKIGEVGALLLSQARSALRVQDGYAKGIHPFLQKKFRHTNSPESEITFGSAELIHLLQRRGYSDDVEIGSLIK